MQPAQPPSSGTGLAGSLVPRLLTGVVVVYIGGLILAPLAALVGGAAQDGLLAALGSLNQPDVLASFANTLWISGLVLLVHTFFGVLVAWVIVRHEFPGKNLLNSLVDLPFAVSPVVVGYMLLLLFGRSGLLGPFLQGLGLRVAFAFPGMALATLFVTLPFMIRAVIPVLESFDRQQEQAAATLGANGWQIFWRITFPVLKWGFLNGVALTFARALGEFGAVLVIGGGIQGRTETATIYIFRALEERQYAGAYTAALVLGLFSMALVLGVSLFQKDRE